MRVFLLSSSSDPCVAKSPFLPRSCGEIIDFFQSNSQDLGDHHLGNSLPVMYGKGFLSKIDQENTDLPPIIRIDRPRPIDNTNPLLDSQSTARSNLSFKPFRDCHGHSSGNKFSLPRF